MYEEERWGLPLFYASLLQAADGVMSLTLCLRQVSRSVLRGTEMITSQKLVIHDFSISFVEKLWRYKLGVRVTSSERVLFCFFALIASLLPHCRQKGLLRNWVRTSSDVISHRTVRPASKCRNEYIRPWLVCPWSGNHSVNNVEQRASDLRPWSN